MSDDDDNAAPIETATIECDASQVVDPKNGVAKGIADIIIGSVKKPIINEINKNLGRKIDNKLDLPKFVANMILKSLDKEDPVNNPNAFATKLGEALNTYVVNDTKLLSPAIKSYGGGGGGGTKQRIVRNRTCRRQKKRMHMKPTRRQTCHR